MKVNRKVALMMAGILLGGCVGNVNVSAAGQPGRKEEVVYANLAEDGASKGAYVVNICKGGEILDYGDYESVINLNTKDPLNYSGGKITASSHAESLYYEGILPQAELPWEIHISYILDGKECPAKELAGKSGNLAIHLSIQKNEQARGDFFEHYAVQATFKLDAERCKNIVAEGATIANAGSKKQITYTVLPGQGKEIEIQAEVTDFEMDSISINGVRMQLGLNKDMVDTDSLIGEVSMVTKAVKTLDKGANRLNNGAGNLCNGLKSLQEGSRGIGTGLSQLSQASGSLTSGSGQFHEGLRKVSGSLEEGLAQMNQAVSAFDGRLSEAGFDSAADFASKQRQAAQGLEITNTQRRLYAAYEASGQDGVLAEMQKLVRQKDEEAVLLYNQLQNGDANSLKVYVSNAGKLIGIQKLLEADASYIEGSSQLIGQCSGSVNQLKKALNTLSENYEKLDRGISDYTDGVSQIENGYEKLSSGMDRILSGADTLHKGTGSLVEGTENFLEKTGEIGETVDARIDDLIAEYSDKDYQPSSFVSEKNTNVDSVQFVLQIPKIEKEPVKATVEEKTEEKNLWQKFIALFGF